MPGRQGLKRTAARLRSRIEENRCRAGAAAGSLRDRALGVIGSPAAIPVAFVCGVLAGRLYGPGMALANLLTANGLTLLRLHRLVHMLRRL